MEGRKQMFDVDLPCGECGTAIKQLPFQPSGDRPVFCLVCLRAKRSQRSERQMYDVALNCAQSECGIAITKLPFQPSGDRPVYCFNCNKARHGA